MGPPVTWIIWYIAQKEGKITCFSSFFYNWLDLQVFFLCSHCYSTVFKDIKVVWKEHLYMAKKVLADDKADDNWVKDIPILNLKKTQNRILRSDSASRIYDQPPRLFFGSLDQVFASPHGRSKSLISQRRTFVWFENINCYIYPAIMKAAILSEGL